MKAAASRRIRCKAEGCSWSVPSFTHKNGRTVNGWIAYADHLAERNGLVGHPLLTAKQIGRIARGFEPGRAAAPAEES